MEIIRNFPAISILLCLFAGIITSVLKARVARILNTVLVLTEIVLNCCTLYYTVVTGESFVYVMGKFPAPWGNEIRAGILEALLALVFCIIMLLSLWGGQKRLMDEISEEKIPLYYVLTNHLLSSLLALVYTNDLFTAYVFVEINTISACGLIMIRQTGKTTEAAARYMIMSLLGSGMLLLGICFLYSMTGHLLMSNIKEQVEILHAAGDYHIPLLITICLMSVGIAIKSALYPFHTWLPNAYGYSTLSSAAILSSLVSKGYIFLLVKIFYRVIGFDIIRESKVINVLFVFGVAGMIMGSLNAIRESDINRMIAYSSVAQIGYIYMGFGLGTTAGMIASIYHIISHAATKSLLFVSGSGLTEVSGRSRDFFDLTGAGYRNKLAGAAFTVGSLSMVGFPMFSGFISKLMFAQAAVENKNKLLITLIALAISVILNAVYFMKTVIRIYTPERQEVIQDKGFVNELIWEQPIKSFALICFIALNVLLGLSSEPIIHLIEKGLQTIG